MNRGQLIVVSGPSGVGKGTVLQQYLAGRQNVAYSVSATTRAPRPGEEDGVHYFFLSKEQFEQTAQSGGMLEYACYNGNYYGTPKAAVERERQQGNDVILEIEVQGALQVKKAARMHCSSLWHRRALNSLPNGCAEGRPRTSRRSTTVLPLREESWRRRSSTTISSSMIPLNRRWRILTASSGQTAFKPII